MWAYWQAWHNAVNGTGWTTHHVGGTEHSAEYCGTAWTWSPYFKFIINIWTPMNKMISLKTFPVTHSKWEKAQKALVENCWLSPYAHLTLFRLVTCPSTACCADALLQDMGTTRRCQDNMSQGSEERDEIGVMGEPSSADIWSPVWERFFVLFLHLSTEHLCGDGFCGYEEKQ